MQSFFEDRLLGIALLEEHLLILAKEHAARHGVALRLEPNLVVQAYDAANGTALFHQIPLEKLSHRKELAHLGFWIAELKPVSILPPQRPRYYLNKAKLAIEGAIKGNTAAITAPSTIIHPPKLTRANKKYQRAEEEYIKAATFPICEYIALEFIQSLMDCEFRRKMDDPTYIAVKASSMDRNEFFQDVLMKRQVFKDLANALRFHIFTPRSFATLIEAVFAFEGL